MTTISPSGPLAGMKVVWTGSSTGARALFDAVIEAGAEIERLPLVSFHPPTDTARIDRIAAHLDQYAWIIFTSQEAVRRTAHWACPSAKVAAVGPATANLLAISGWPVNLIPESENAAGLADAFCEMPLPSRPVLFVRGDKATKTLPKRMGAAGFRVDEVEVYGTPVK